MSFSVPVYPSMALLSGFQQQFLQQLDAEPGRDETCAPLEFQHDLQHTLMQALNEIYSASRVLLGDAFFAGLASHYLRRFPPSILRLECFGCLMPEFVESFAPARQQLQLQALVRLEWAIYLAAKSRPGAQFNQAGFIAASVQQPERIQLHLAPGVSLLKARYAVDLLWQHHRQQLGAAGLKYLDHGDVRLAVQVRDGRLQIERLNSECWTLLQQLQANPDYAQLVAGCDENALGWVLARGWVSHFSLAKAETEPGLHPQEAPQHP